MSCWPPGTFDSDPRTLFQGPPAFMRNIVWLDEVRPLTSDQPFRNLFDLIPSGPLGRRLRQHDEEMDRRRELVNSWATLMSTLQNVAHDALDAVEARQTSLTTLTLPEEGAAT